MKKEYIIGGLALLGIIGVVSYLRKPKRNSEGFFGASGRGGGSYGLGCKVCERENGSTYFAKFGGCADGDFCTVSVRPKKLQ
jgi:hypothetical protein